MCKVVYATNISHISCKIAKNKLPLRKWHQQLALISTQTHPALQLFWNWLESAFASAIPYPSTNSSSQRHNQSGLNLVLHSLTDFRSICCDKVIVKFHTSAESVLSVGSLLHTQSSCFWFWGWGHAHIFVPSTALWLQSLVAYFVLAQLYAKMKLLFKSRPEANVSPTVQAPAIPDHPHPTHLPIPFPLSSSHPISIASNRTPSHSDCSPCPCDLTVWFCWHFI